MLSNTLLTAAIKNGATNGEIYELVRLIWGKSMKKTYYSLLKNDKCYQSLLTKTDIAEKELSQQQMSLEARSSAWQYCKYKDIFDSRIIINSTAKFYISISYQKDLLSIDTRIFTPSIPLNSNNLSYLRYSLWYPVAYIYLCKKQKKERPHAFPPIIFLID